METKSIIGKTIEEAEINGHNVRIKFTDGTLFEYCASDGGYSTWHIGYGDEDE